MPKCTSINYTTSCQTNIHILNSTKLKFMPKHCYKQVWNIFEVVVWTTVHLTAFHSTWMLHFKCSLHRTLCTCMQSIANARTQILCKSCASTASGEATFKPDPRTFWLLQPSKLSWSRYDHHDQVRPWMLTCEFAGRNDPPVLPTKRS